MIMIIIMQNTGKDTACIPDQHMIVQNLDKLVNKIIIY